MVSGFESLLMVPGIEAQHIATLEAAKKTKKKKKEERKEDKEEAIKFVFEGGQPEPHEYNENENSENGENQDIENGENQLEGGQAEDNAQHNIMMDTIAGGINEIRVQKDDDHRFKQFQTLARYLQIKQFFK